MGWGISIMKDITDKLTYFIKVATDILFVRNPVNTSMGVLFGVILHGIVSILSPTAKIVKSIKISALTIFHYIAIGVFSFNIKPFLSRHKINKSVEEAIAFIERQERERKITRLEAKQLYRKLISHVVENVQLDTSTASRVDKIINTLDGK